MNEDIHLPEKPDWESAPDWAEAIGISTWDCDYKGEWCWMRSAESKYFAHVEVRPNVDAN